MSARSTFPKLFEDNRGRLLVLDALPFPVQRIFWISDVPHGERRGGHAHRTCHQVLFCVRGHLIADISSPSGSARSWELYPGGPAVEVPPMHWISLHHFTPEAVLMVLASESYQVPISDYYDWLMLCHENDPVS